MITKKACGMAYLSNHHEGLKYVKTNSFLFSNINSIQDLSLWSTLVVAFHTLGVVYGDLGTSPLYVFSDVFSKVPIKSEVDVLGALSLVMYTITLIPFAKYVFVVLKANDNGEGMECRI